MSKRDFIITWDGVRQQRYAGHRVRLDQIAQDIRCDLESDITRVVTAMDLLRQSSAIRIEYVDRDGLHYVTVALEMTDD